VGHAGDRGIETLIVALLCAGFAALGFVGGVGLSRSYEDLLIAARRAVNLAGTSAAEDSIETLDAELRNLRR
jgi:hypothetical protein